MNPWYEILVNDCFEDHDKNCKHKADCVDRKNHVEHIYVPQALKRRVERLQFENKKLRVKIKEMALENARLLALVKELKQREDPWTKVFDCKISHEEPYDFDYCSTHDRTFEEGGMCDHVALSEINYLDKKHMEQRGRAVIAEMKMDEIRRLAEIALEEGENRVSAADIINILGE